MSEHRSKVPVKFQPQHPGTTPAGILSKLEPDAPSKSKVGSPIHDQFTLSVITRFLTLKERIILSMASSRHHEYLNKHGLNYVVYNIANQSSYRNGTDCPDIDGLMITLMVGRDF